MRLTCVPYKLQKPLESGMAAGKRKASFRKEVPQCAHWGGGLRFAEQNIRSKPGFCKLVCFAHFACGEIQSSVSLWLTAPFQRSLALRGTAELHGEAFGQTRTCGFDRRIRAQRVQALGAPEYKNAPAPTRRGAVNRSQERPNLRYLAVCTGQNR